MKKHYIVILNLIISVIVAYYIFQHNQTMIIALLTGMMLLNVLLPYSYIGSKQTYLYKVIQHISIEKRRLLSLLVFILFFLCLQLGFSGLALGFLLAMLVVDFFPQKKRSDV